MEEEPDYLLPLPMAEPQETDVVDEWRTAEAGNAARLARVAGRIGELDDRLKRGGPVAVWCRSFDCAFALQLSMASLLVHAHPMQGFHVTDSF